MNNAPSYHVWYPSVDRRGALVSVFLTRGHLHTAPLPAYGIPFFEEVISAAGVAASVVSGGFEAFLTRYFGQEWEECWEAKILVEGGARPPASDVVGVPVYRSPQTAAEPSRDASLWVLADFVRRKDVEECRRHLVDQRDQGAWDEVRFHRDRIRTVGAKHRQIVVEFSAYQRARDDVVAAAERAAAICAEHDGRVRGPSRPDTA